MTYHPYPGDPWVEAPRMDEVDVTGLPKAEPTYGIEGHWLVEYVNRHTCGTDEGGHFGAHERGCGTVPALDLAQVQGWAEHVSAIKAEALREAREEVRAFSQAIGFGDGVTEPSATLAQMVDPILQALSDGREHVECAILCELCGERLADKECPQCHGGGCLPNAQLAYLECDTCAGAGKIHEGCVEKSYAELAAESRADRIGGTR